MTLTSAVITSWGEGGLQNKLLLIQMPVCRSLAASGGEVVFYSQSFEMRLGGFHEGHLNDNSLNVECLNFCIKNRGQLLCAPLAPGV